MQKFTFDTAKSHIYTKLMAKGIFQEEDINAKVKEIEAAIPPSTRDQYDADPMIAAAQYVDTYMSDASTDVSVVADQGDASIVVATAVTPTLSREQEDALAHLLEDSTPERTREFETAYIKQFLVQKPKPSTYLEGKKVIPQLPGKTEEEKQSKLAYYEAHLVQDPKNIENFEMIKAAIGKEELPVHINDKSMKIEGVVVHRVVKEGAKDVEKDFPMSDLQFIGYLATKTWGKVTSTKSDVGAELRQVRATAPKGTRASAAPATGAPQVTYVGKKNLNERYDEFALITCEQDLDGAKNPLYKKATVPVAQEFVIEVPDANDPNKSSKRKIRLRGHCEIPVFKRKDEYLAVLSPLKSEKIIPAVLSEEALAESKKNIAELVSYATSGRIKNGAEAYGKDFRSMITDVASKEETVSTASANSYE